MKRLLLVFAALLLLHGCGGGGGGGSTSSSGTTTPTPSTSTSGVTVQWTAPSLRIDGAALSASSIQGYRVYYGTASGVYTTYVEITGNTTFEYTFTTLSTGTTYYFAVTSFDTAGVESGYSNEISKAL